MAVLELARTDILSHSVSVVKRFDPQLPRVYGDAVQIQQVLLNLIVNACEAMADTAGARRLTVTTAVDGGDHVRVSVSDTGAGVVRDQAEQIFEPFVSSKPDRIGFGLTICRSVVASHHGEISVTGQSNEGATFSFSLPFTDAPWKEAAVFAERSRRPAAPRSTGVR
jgi:signal transduction histidine kinase